jgi:hypothetical protein
VPVARHVATLHADVPHDVLKILLTAIEEALIQAGGSRVWIDTSVHRDIAVMADLPGPGTEGGQPYPAAWSSVPPPDPTATGTATPSGLEQPRSGWAPATGQRRAGVPGDTDLRPVIVDYL